MSRPHKVRQVFTELKKAMGRSMSSSDLLECAWLIVSSSEGNDIRPRHDNMIGPTPFEELSLDVLYERCEWKLLCEEYRSEEHYTPRQRSGDLINQLLGQAA